ncbi:inhibitor of the pro-sigma K processing machinery [Proteiniborus ethanoligenes]|uniref:Inhibitor of the pro-sigma K processing machinery n=1 Tax=Proteiniborus ethanoligenes TaxID=415015 RepID=A0A1H3PE02_9FIRM|nr:pro-sigmaK processing inhibitor BofA family protein [Proteiniborus ethanoligenes]SDY99311.1 inhibitor of the pro-sigma K processing machinery [Proteiniborus ethanoligenes]
MGLGIEISVILAYAGGLILLYFLGWLLIIPIKYLLKLIINGITGGILLLLVNLLGGFVGISVAINPVTALIAGFLGVPGVILLIVLQYIL